jgi:hypothetical protein
VYDEGTFNIFFTDSQGYHYVSFHGFDDKRGYRGVAKTLDFANYIAGDSTQGVAADAIFDRLDATGWRENWLSDADSDGNIGPGAGSILFENGLFYQILEVADLDLRCTEGQTWDWGIMRSASLTNVTWEQFPQGNPIVYSPKDPSDPNQKCTPSYARLFKDPDTNIIYMHFTRGPNFATPAGYLYQLVHDTNLLDNADLWKCTTASWQTIPIGPTNLVVYRVPQNSSDGGCYLATNCGTSPCQPNQSIYQDVNVAGLGAQQISYGGKFAVDSGSGASLGLAVFELDANYGIIASHSIDGSPTTSYQQISSTFAMSDATKILRYQLYLNTTHTFRADEMFMNVGACPTAQLTWSAQALSHNIGRADGDGWSANIAQDEEGHLQYGPYTTQVAAGTHTAVWNLMIDNNTADNRQVVRLDVYDATADTILASRDVTRKEWTSTFQYQPFSLPFVISGEQSGRLLEFRVYWYKQAYIREQNVSVDPTCQSEPTWYASSLPHVIGRADGDGWSANTAQDEQGHLQFGPYTTQVAAGAHTAMWKLMIDNNTADNHPIVRLDVYDFTTDTVLASIDVTRQQWATTYQYQGFSLPFTIDDTQVGHQLEFRVFWYKKAYVREQLVSLD